MRYSSFVAGLPVVLLWLPHVEAQPAEPTIHVQTRVVQIEVTARDAKGHSVTNLSKSDFVVRDEGKLRTIDIFSMDRGEPGGPPPVLQSPAMGGGPLPQGPSVFSNRNPAHPVTQHSSIILLDHANGNGNFDQIAIERESVIDFLKKLDGNERIALYVIGRLEGLILVQDYTTNRDLLLKSMREYSPRYTTPPSFPQAAGAPPPIVPLQVEDTAEDVRLSLQSLAEHLALVPGRKSVFWVSRGFPPRQMHGPAWEQKNQDFDPPSKWQKTIDTLNEADAAVNAVDSSDRPRDPVAGPALLMKQLAEATGGHGFFYGSHDLGKALAEGIEESHATYTLGFYLAETERDDKFHDLKVETTRPGIQLSYRKGYYAGQTELPVGKPEKNERMESLLLNQVDSHGVGITANVDVTLGEPRGTVNIHLNLDTHTLSLQEQPGKWTGKVDELFIELNDQGRTLAKVSDTKNFEFTAADRARYENQGVTWPFSVPYVPGAVKMTIIVRDDASGRVGSLTVPLQ
jgi:VWFA-related protein